MSALSSTLVARPLLIALLMAAFAPAGCARNQSGSSMDDSPAVIQEHDLLVLTFSGVIPGKRMAKPIRIHATDRTALPYASDMRLRGLTIGEAEQVVRHVYQDSCSLGPRDVGVTIVRAETGR